jgi:hypothetical protein
LLIEVEAHRKAVGSFAVEHIEFAAFRTRGFAYESEFNLSRRGSNQQPAEHDLVKLTALLQLHIRRHWRIWPEHASLASLASLPPRSSGAAWPTRTTPHDHHTATHSHSGNEFVPNLIAIEGGGNCSELAIIRFLYLVRHEDVYFEVAFRLPLSGVRANCAGDGHALQFFQFLFVADGGAGLFEYLFGLRFGVGGLGQREGRDRNGHDNRQDQLAHFDSPYLADLYLGWAGGKLKLAGRRLFIYAKRLWEWTLSFTTFVI